MPSHVTKEGTVGCAHEGCGRTFTFAKYGLYYEGNEGWFHQYYKADWCPDHIPDWIDGWVEVIRPYRPSIGNPNIEKREHLQSLNKE